MANRKLGIHLAPGALKLVEIEQQGDQLKVLNYAIEYFPPDKGSDSSTKALISALKKYKIHAKDAQVVVSGADIVYKLIEMPEMPEKDLVSALQYKLKSILPVAFKDAVMDYYKIEKIKRPGKQMYFVAAAPEEKMLEVIESLKTAGLSLKDIIAPSCALKNASGISSSYPAALIYLGKYSSLIVLVKEGQVVFAREVKVGGDDIAQSMVGSVQTAEGKLEFDYSRAEETKNKYGIPVDLERYSSEAGLPATEVMAMMRPALEKISAEILNTFDYYRREIGDETEFKNPTIVGKVYFSGGTSKIKNLLEYFRGQLGLEIEPLPIHLPSLKKDFVEAAPFLTLALGAVTAGKDHLSLIPRKGGEFLLGNLLAAALKELKKRLKYVFWVFLYLLILAVIFGWFSVQQKNLNAALRTLQKKYQGQTAKLGKETEATRGIIDLMKYSQRDRFTLVMQELDKITPGVIYLKNLSYDNNDNALTMKGIVLEDGGKTSAANFMGRLNKSNYFKSVDLVYLEESSLYTVPAYDFELKCVLVGEGKK